MKSVSSCSSQSLAAFMVEVVEGAKVGRQESEQPVSVNYYVCL